MQDEDVLVQLTTDQFLLAIQQRIAPLVVANIGVTASYTYRPKQGRVSVLFELSGEWLDKKEAVDLVTHTMGIQQFPGRETWYFTEYHLHSKVDLLIEWEWVADY